MRVKIGQEQKRKGEKMKKKVISTLLIFAVMAGLLLAGTAKAPSESWDVVLTATLGIYSDLSYFGVRSDATDGFDLAYDKVDPPLPPTGVVSYFWYPDNPATPVNLRKLSTSKIPPSTLMTWTYNVTAADTGGGTMYITWSASDIANVPVDYGVYLQCPDGSIIDMRTVTEHSFSAVDGTTYGFTIYVGGYDFDLLLSAGWNMVSFPCIPIDDASFDNIFNGISYYQVLTWDGASYVTLVPSDEPEAGRGYWVLVLEAVTVTITNGFPVDSYELDLPAGWSMIGSVITGTVDPGLVFPSYYQLLTWGGTSYVDATTIEPGKGYWALVLVETHIVVD